MKRFIVLISLTCAFLAGCKTQPAQVAHTPGTETFVLSSPDGMLFTNVYLDRNGTPVYELNYKDTPVMLPSALGFELRGTVKYQGLEYRGSEILKPDELPPYMFNSGFEIVDHSFGTLDDTWEPVGGQEKSIRNHYN